MMPKFYARRQKVTSEFAVVVSTCRPDQMDWTNEKVALQQCLFRQLRLAA
jgi:hypothetical protein